MASKTQAQRIEVLEQQMTELLAGQMQTEARIEAKFDTLGEILRTQIASAFKEHQSGSTGKATNHKRKRRLRSVSYRAREK